MYPKPKILISEKILSILSYMTFGIVGFLWIFLASIKKRKIKYFLSYHIYQSIFIAVLLTLFNYLFDALFFICSKIPFIDIVSATINYYLSVKIISVFGFQSTLVYLAVLFLKIYLIVGVIMGRYLYIPFVTKTMNYFMQKIYE